MVFNKKKISIFVIILIIIILLIVSVYYFFTLKNTNQIQPTSGLTDAQRTMILSQLDAGANNVAISEKERTQILDTLKKESLVVKPLTDDERTSVLNSLNNKNND